FRFTVALQKFFKENIGRTYEDAITFWYEENERKKDPAYKTTIGTQFEYNRFIRDFFEDPNNKGKSKADVIVAWNEIKVKPGSNAYIPQKV
ncbi:cytoplasmic protein, partial [Bacillus thuringiensis]